MLGPHQGKELELMLAGKKHLAVFYDALLPNQPIPEEIIPEESFAPYIKNGTIKRFTQTLVSPKSPIPAYYVCYTLAGHEWRAEAFFWMQQECYAGRRPFDDAYEYFIGRLLDYTDADIEEFIRHLRQQRKIPA